MKRRGRESSPSSRRGSIAALNRCATARDFISVFPVITTGLHCGIIAAVTFGWWRRCLPRHHDGAPLRQPCLDRVLVDTAGLPRHHDGAPLRRQLSRGGFRLRLVFPVITTGLHCGGDTSRWPPRLVVMSSPSSRRGSIAASLRCPSWTAPACLPRHHDGAPLRPAHRRAGRGHLHRVFPVITTGLHCGVMRPCAASSVRRVFPVITTGLHCGRYPARSRRTCRQSLPRHHDGAPLRPGQDLFGDSVVLRSSPSSRRGSIAATDRCGTSTRRGRLPRHHDGAPLRPSMLPGPSSALVPVFPVITTGLHCGSSLRCRSGRQFRVFPVITTGLHCGVEAGVPVDVDRFRLPRHHDGAPLRLEHVVDDAPRSDESSPSSRRGSIAASAAAPTAHVRSGSSPSSRRGSIAA